MAFKDDSEIERIGLGLLDRTLPKSCWTHAAHFAAAIWLLRHRPELTAPLEIARIIRTYNEATGTPNTDTGGYHATITLASMRAASQHLGRYPAATELHLIVNALMASPLGRPDWLLSYWSREKLFSTAARRGWIEPDVAPTPPWLAKS